MQPEEPNAPKPMPISEKSKVIKKPRKEVKLGAFRKLLNEHCYDLKTALDLEQKIQLFEATLTLDRRHLSEIYDKGVNPELFDELVA